MPKVSGDNLPERIEKFNTLQLAETLTGSAVITNDVTTGTGYCLVGFNWIIDFFN